MPDTPDSPNAPAPANPTGNTAPDGDEFHEATTIAERFKKLEMRTLTAIVLALFPTLMLPPLIAHSANAHRGGIQTQEVTLTDAEGKAQARVKVAEDGALRISMLDADANVKSTMTLGAGEVPRMVLTDRQGEVIFSTPIPGGPAPATNAGSE